jgi:terminase, large subunit
VATRRSVADRIDRAALAWWRASARELADSLYAPRERLGIVDWIEKHIELPPGSPRPGRFSYDYTPYLRDIIATMGDARFTYGAVVKAGQVGYSVGVLINYIGWRSVEQPDSITLMLPTGEEAESFSKDKIRNLLEYSLIVGNAFPGFKARDSDNTILEKRMRAGPILRVMGSNSTSKTRSFTAPVLLFDEIDEYDPDGKQGDVVKLLQRAQIQFGHGRMKTMLGSTPTWWRNAHDGDEATQHERGTGSRAYREFLNGDRRRWWLRCVHCRQKFLPDWRRFVRWPSEGTHEERAAAAYLVCPDGCEILPHLKPQAVALGGYEAERPNAGFPSWHIHGLLSQAPGMDLPKLVLEFLNAGKDPVKLQPFWNLKMGEPFEDRRKASIVVQSLADRRRPYAAEVPADVGLITIAVDVQASPARLEVLVVGWGAGEESWRLHHFRLYGDTSQLKALPGQPPSVWQRLDEIIARRWQHESGLGVKATRVVIDSGDQTTTVYQYVQPRQAWGVIAVKGEERLTGIVKKTGTPTLIKPGKAAAKGSDGVALWLTNTYALKDRLFQRLRLEGGRGPGYMHWPLLLNPDGSVKTDEFPPDYFSQFRNESLVEQKLNKESAETQFVYVKTGPNEAIDLEVMSLAALELCGADTKAKLGALAADLRARGEAHRAGLPLPAPAAAVPARRRSTGGFHRPR